MLHFGTQSGNNLVWGQRTTTNVVSDGSGIQQEKAVRSWVSLPGQTTGGIGFYRTETGQPLTSHIGGAYTFDTYVTTYGYLSGSYSFALQVYLALTEALTLHDSGIFSVVMEVSLTEALTLQDTPTTSKIAFAGISEMLTLNDATSFNVVFGITLAEDLQLLDSIATNIPLLSYVVNMNTAALTKYIDFNFNSFSHLNGKYYGMTDNGIYELDGDTDDGAVIAAYVTLGKDDFGTDLLKHMATVYIGARTTGDLILKVLTDSGNVNYYTIVTPTVQTMRNNRTLLGKGLRSRYWQFEISNVDGSDISFDSITFNPISTTRRIG